MAVYFMYASPTASPTRHASVRGAHCRLLNGFGREREVQGCMQEAGIKDARQGGHPWSSRGDGMHGYAQTLTPSAHVLVCGQACVLVFLSLSTCSVIIFS